MKKILILGLLLLFSISNYLFCETLYQQFDSQNTNSNVKDSLSFVGKVIPAEFKTWVDDTTGYEITQWTSKGLNYHPYFTTESFIDDETAIIYSMRTGKKQLYKLNFNNGKMIQMTVADNLNHFNHLREFKKAWYMDGKKLYTLNTTTLESSFVYDFGKFPYKVGSSTITCDGKWFVFGVNKKIQTKEDLGYGPYAIYKLNLLDKSLVQITLDVGYPIGHIQANPKDPNLIMYCWQWQRWGRPLLVGHAPIRIWWVNIDGTDGGPVPQEYGTQRTHETWTADGKYIAYISKYRMGKNKGVHFMGLETLDGKVNKVYYSQVSPGHQNIFKDNKHWIVDSYNNEEPYLVMFTRGENKLEETKILFRHDSTLEGQHSHPHPRISPNGRYVLFSTDRTSIAQVYTVKINLDKKNK